MPKRIVVLDGFTLTPNRPGRVADPAEPVWDAIASIDGATLEVHDRTPEPDIVARVGDAPLVLTNKTPLTADTLARLPGLRYIGLLATGTNVVDLAAAGRAGVCVTNVPAYSTESVAQHVFALLLAMTNRVAEHDAAARAGAWARGPDFSFTLSPLVELAGKAIGIVGLGDIGARVARIADALGMEVLAHSRSRKDIGVPGVWCSLDELLAGADVVTLHCPLTEATRHLINADRLARMRPGAYLINTGRGPLIDEPALAAALAEGRIAGAGLDVLSAEPPPADHPLLAPALAGRCVVTPHTAWATREARRRLMAKVAENLRAFLDGRPQNVVSR